MIKVCKNELGFTIVELLIVISVGALLLMATVAFFGRGFGIYRSQFEQVLSVEEARIQMNRLSSSLRDARDFDASTDWLVLAEDYSITFYSNIDDDVTIEQVLYSVSADGEFTRTVDGGDSAIIARGIRNRVVGSEVEMFVYYNDSGDVLDAAGRTADLVESIGITLVVDNDLGQLPNGVVVSTRITPRQKGSIAVVDSLRPVDVVLGSDGNATITIDGVDTVISINALNDGRVRVYENAFYAHMSTLIDEWTAWMGSSNPTDQISITDLETAMCLNSDAVLLQELLDSCSSGFGYDPVFTYTSGGVTDFIRSILDVVSPAACGGANIFPPNWRGEVDASASVWDAWDSSSGILAPAPYITPDSWVGYLDWPLDFPFSHLSDSSVVQILDDYQSATRVAVIPESKEYVFDLQNYRGFVLGSVKEVRLQVAWRPEVGQTAQVQMGSSDGGIDAGIGSWTRLSGPDANGWVTDLYENRLYPAPTTETFALSFGSGDAYVDQVSIDTYSVVAEEDLCVGGVLACDLGAFPPSWRNESNANTAVFDDWAVNPDIPVVQNYYIAPDSWEGFVNSPPMPWPYVLGYTFGPIPLPGSVQETRYGRSNVLQIPRSVKLFFSLRNSSGELAVREARVQVVWRPSSGAGGEQTMSMELGSSSVGITFEEGEWFRVNGPDGDGWVTDVYTGWFFPSPESELFTLSFAGGSSTVYVDSVIIDTYATVEENLCGITPLSAMIVNSPRGIEFWGVGTSEEIQWSLVGFEDPNVKIELYKNDVFFSTIAASTSNDGSYDWSIPEDHSVGSSYKVKISSVLDPLIFGLSDDDFNIQDIQIVEDEDASFVASGSWLYSTSVGRGVGSRYKFSGSGSEKTAWAFTVVPGQYEVAATWVGSGDRVSDAPYTVFDGSSPFATVDLSQQIDPDDYFASGSDWERVGTFTITGNTLNVELSDDSDDAGQYLIADAIRIRRVAP